MNGSPVVSIIIHFLNAEKFLEEAIESVFRQTYENWELLLIDDGSSDCSGPIALSYQKRHPGRVRCLRHAGGKNLGMSASRNLGVRQARGEYVAFLDADDVWGERKLEEQEAILRREPEAAMVYGATEYWYSWTGRPDDLARDLLIRHGVEADRVVAPPTLLISFLLGETAVPCPSDILIRRAAIERAGGFEESFRYIFTDQVFYAKLCLKEKVYVSNKCWFKYRRHQDSSVSLVKKRGQLRVARLSYLKWLGQYLKDNGVKDAEVLRAVKQEQWKCSHPDLARLLQHTRYRALITEEVMKSAARRSLPGPVYRWLRAQWKDRIERSKEAAKE